MAGKRQRALNKALTELIPQAPFYDAELIRARAAQPHLRALAPEAAMWLAIIAYIRHVYTDYDILRDEGYEHEAARFFVANAINAKLEEWRASRFLDNSAESEAAAADYAEAAADNSPDSANPAKKRR